MRFTAQLLLQLFLSAGKGKIEPRKDQSTHLKNTVNLLCECNDI
jgi:hypothetical protein